MFRFAFLDFDFYFSSPAAKMPRITASGDDAVMGKTVPSNEDITMVDTPMMFPTSNFKSSSTPTSIQIQNSGAAHTKMVALVAYVLCSDVLHMHGNLRR